MRNDDSDVVDPAVAWLRLHDAVGDRATLIDRYEIEAAFQGRPVDQLTDADRIRMRHEVLPVLFPGWTESSEGGHPDPVVVVDYDSQWPERFAARHRRLRQAVSGTEVVIEHIGSTAVPGLAAKPVIDIMVAVPDCSDEAAYVAAVETCGVNLRSRDDGHRYFRPAPPLPRTVQIHVVDIGSDWQHRHLLFRDYLLVHPEAAAAYGRLKKDLAVKYRDDRLAYNAAKTHFILDEMDKAKRWRP